MPAADNAKAGQRGTSHREAIKWIIVAAASAKAVECGKLHHEELSKSR